MAAEPGAAGLRHGVANHSGPRHSQRTRCPTPRYRIFRKHQALDVRTRPIAPWFLEPAGSLLEPTCGVAVPHARLRFCLFMLVHAGGRFLPPTSALKDGYMKSGLSSSRSRSNVRFGRNFTPFSVWTIQGGRLVRVLILFSSLVSRSATGRPLCYPHCLIAESKLN